MEYPRITKLQNWQRTFYERWIFRSFGYSSIHMVITSLVFQSEKVRRVLDQYIFYKYHLSWLILMTILTLWKKLNTEVYETATSSPFSCLIVQVHPILSVFSVISRDANSFWSEDTPFDAIFSHKIHSNDSMSTDHLRIGFRRPEKKKAKSSFYSSYRKIQKLYLFVSPLDWQSIL